MPLPDGWIAKESRSTGKTYYYNTVTQESQWELPTEAAVSENEPAKVRASHLLVKHNESRRPSSWKSETIIRTKEEALGIIEGYKLRIKAGEISLEELALTESDCSSAKQGGDLGFFTRGKMQKKFEDVSFALEVGEVSDAVFTDSGIHLIFRTA
ncbi:peptidyl-prolyl cis-trans isomerase NIMA-interacting 1-like [Rhopilema esculentum]|uniref:peptidyl-prolyl cis-trans isomerase NIMA-interacting 1-like n=1 Tax=Rhopilema esculentum TaxID=499914 RepID=UPI0031DCA626